jgi:large subunit ribosomal protein L9
MATSYVLLLEDVEHVGRSGDIVGVKPGFARNFLIPQRKAVVATSQTRRLQARLQEERAVKAAADLAQAEALAEQLHNRVYTIDVKTDPDGNLYGSVAATDIIEFVGRDGFVLEKRMIDLSHPIKTVGEHKVHLRLKEGVVCSIMVVVNAEAK